MFKRNETGLSSDYVATMVAHAASSLEKLAVLDAAISELAGRPRLAHDLARAAYKMFEELAGNFGECKRKCDAQRATLAVQGDTAA